VEEKPKIGGKSMSGITMKQMLEAGLHFGHQTRRWNPKMKPYIFGPRNGIYIINLDKSIRLFRKAYDYIIEETSKGGYILFVGTKRQAQAIIKEEAIRCGMYYINHRWLGGTLTNFQTIKKGVDRLKSIEAMQEDGSISKLILGVSKTCAVCQPLFLSLIPTKSRLLLRKPTSSTSLLLPWLTPIATLKAFRILSLAMMMQSGQSS
jgi:hypothetical protein